MPGIVQPILLIHGFRGQPNDWTLDSGFRDFLIQEGGFDPDLVRLFHYGYRLEDGQRLYDYQKDIRLSAHRLASRGIAPLCPYYPTDAPEIQLATLSRDSQARGGPAKVDIVAHSMGGMVARYYLSCRQPDAWGTYNEGLVGKLITIGTPHLGVDLLRTIEAVPRGSWAWRFLCLLDNSPFFRDKPVTEVEEFEAGLRIALSQAQERSLGPDRRAVLASTALQQLTPGSEFLKALNEPGKMPKDVDYYCLAGNIICDIKITVWGWLFFHREISLGDLLIEHESATTIPGVQPKVYTFGQRLEFALNVGSPAGTGRRAGALAHLLPVEHGALLANRQVQETVLGILKGKA